MAQPQEENCFHWSVGQCDGVCYSDGAGQQSRTLPGGEIQEAPDFAKRVGSGAVCLEWRAQELVDFAFAASSVQGRQTVPRAELRGAMVALPLTARPHVLNKADASYVVKGWSERQSLPG